jgi:hypothetical protein
MVRQIGPRRDRDAVRSNALLASEVARREGQQLRIDPVATRAVAEENDIVWLSGRQRVFDGLRGSSLVDGRRPPGLEKSQLWIEAAADAVRDASQHEGRRSASPNSPHGNLDAGAHGA